MDKKETIGINNFKVETSTGGVSYVFIFQINLEKESFKDSLNLSINISLPNSSKKVIKK